VTIAFVLIVLVLALKPAAFLRKAGGDLGVGTWCRSPDFFFGRWRGCRLSFRGFYAQSAGFTFTYVSAGWRHVLTGYTAW